MEARKEFFTSVRKLIILLKKLKADHPRSVIATLIIRSFIYDNDSVDDLQLGLDYEYSCGYYKRLSANIFGM
jgi:hypothetical protein